jgi:hypothetical protein
MAKLARAKPEDSTYVFCCGEDMDMKITGFLYQQERGRETIKPPSDPS